MPDLPALASISKRCTSTGIFPSNPAILAGMKKIRVTLPKPMPASNDCLPHAAMNLGSARGVGIQPRVGLVSRIIIEPQFDSWVLYRMDDGGGFVGDTSHATREDAIRTAEQEFGIDVSALAE